jgi:hypothetical protein
MVWLVRSGSKLVNSICHARYDMDSKYFGYTRTRWAHLYLEYYFDSNRIHQKHINTYIPRTDWGLASAGLESTRIDENRIILGNSSMGGVVMHF